MPAISEPPTSTLLDKAVLISLKISQFGNSKRIKDDVSVEFRASGEQVDTASNPRIRLSKTLLDSPELEAVKKLLSEARQYVYSRCVPSFSMEGVHFLSIDQIDEMEAKLADYSEKLKILVQVAADTLETRIEEARVPLGPAWRAEDFPSRQEFIDSFSLEWRYLALKVPENLKDKKGLWERENEKAEAKMAEAESSIRRLLRSNFLDVLSHLIERLEGKRENGSPKIFRDSTLTNVIEFINGFAFRNLTEDEALAGLIADALETLDGVTAEDLRSDELIRDNTLSGLTTVRQSLEQLMAVGR